MVQGGTDTRPESGRIDVLYSLRMYPAFRVLFGTTLTTNAAFWMWSLLIGWLALLLTDSPFFVGLTGFLNGIPMLIVSLPAGVLIDRVDRRAVLLLAQIVVALVTVVLVVFLWFDWLRPWQLLLAAFRLGDRYGLRLRDTQCAGREPGRP